MKKFLFCLLYILISTITANAQNGWEKLHYTDENNHNDEMLAYEDEGYRITIHKDGMIIIESLTMLDFSFLGHAITSIGCYDINDKLVSENSELFEKIDDFSMGVIQSKENQKRLYDYITKQKGSICIIALPFGCNINKEHHVESEVLYFVAPCINN